jgi:hypothetical protein
MGSQYRIQISKARQIGRNKNAISGNKSQENSAKTQAEEPQRIAGSKGHRRAPKQHQAWRQSIGLHCHS